MAGNRPRILVVEDEAELRQVLCHYLGNAGFQPLGASSAEQALELLETQHFDVLLADIRLPGMDGLDLTEIATNSHDMVAIVMTGFIDEYTYEQAINKGATDFVLKPVRNEEMVLRVNRSLREHTLTRERLETLTRVQKLAITDELTQLHNCRHFYSQLKTESDRANRYERTLSLLLFDVDYFKEFNDRYGHLNGNTVLTRIGQIIKSCLRTMDSGYRYGGEEFTLILPETDIAAAATVAERLRSAVALEEFHPVAGETVQLTISTGLAEYVPNEDLNSFVQRADKAMYEAKRQGRNMIATESEDSG